MKRTRGDLSRTEQKLYDGAHIHWRGSENHLVDVYRAFTGRESLWAAATIVVLLREPAQRAAILDELGRKLPRSTRSGPKKDREVACDRALQALLTKHADDVLP